jgi:hypothetical protein
MNSESWLRKEEEGEVEHKKDEVEKERKKDEAVLSMGRRVSQFLSPPLSPKSQRVTFGHEFVSFYMCCVQNFLS